MSNETDLDWLARNVHVWHEGANYVCVNHTDGGHVFHEHNRNCAIWFTKGQWLAHRAELQNKPSWADAPEWGEWLAQDDSGDWYWYASKPTNPGMKSWWPAPGANNVQCGKGEVLGEWCDTLEKRPEQTIADICREVTGENRHEEIFEPFVSVEDAKITIMQSDGDVKNFGGIIGRNILAKEDAATAKQPSITPSKYTKTIHGVSVDVYDVLQAWGVSNPALQHLIKKSLQCGQRGHKDNAQDLQDIIDSAIRAKELG